jgi:hypothetical protein
MKHSHSTHENGIVHTRFRTPLSTYGKSTSQYLYALWVRWCRTYRKQMERYRQIIMMMCYFNVNNTYMKTFFTRTISFCRKSEPFTEIDPLVADLSYPHVFTGIDEGSI